MNPKNDPLVKAQAKAYRESAVGQLEKLMKEESHWKRKETIASNKLKEVRTLISQCALQLGTESDKREVRGSILERAKALGLQTLADRYAPFTSTEEGK